MYVLCRSLGNPGYLVSIWYLVWYVIAPPYEYVARWVWLEHVPCYLVGVCLTEK